MESIMLNRQLMAVRLAGQREGLKLKAYPDTKGIATIGYGTIRYPGGSPVKLGDTITQAQAEEYMNNHLAEKVYGKVNDLCAGTPVPDKVYAALCSLVYNVGDGVLVNDSFMKCILTQDWGSLKMVGDEVHTTGLASVFIQYNKQRVNGVLEVVPGLTNRRIIEIQYFLS
jgi:lysozyme